MVPHQDPSHRNYIASAFVGAEILQKGVAGLLRSQDTAATIEKFIGQPPEDIVSADDAVHASGSVLGRRAAIVVAGRDSRPRRRRGGANLLVTDILLLCKLSLTGII